MNTLRERFCSAAVAAAIICASGVAVIKNMDAYAATQYNMSIQTDDEENTYAVYHVGTITKSGARYSFTTDSSFSAFFTAANSGYSVQTVDNTSAIYDPDGNVVTEENSAAVTTLANKLALYAKNRNLSPSTTVTGSSVESLDMGYYLIVQTSVGDTDIENGYFGSRPILVTLTRNATVTPKKGQVEINKAFSNTVISEKANAGSIGDTFSYTVSSTIPNYGESDIDNIDQNNIVYKIHDTFPVGLTYNDAMLNVELASNILESGTDYSSNYNSSTRELTVTILDKSLILDNANQSVVISYDATLNSDAVTDSEAGNLNTATLEVSANPFANNSTMEVSDTATVYTYGLTICNADRDNDEVYNLNGSAFNILNADGTLVLKSITMPASGDSCEKVYGLGPGSYMLKQTTKPNNVMIGGEEVSYKLITTNIPFSIGASEGGDGTSSIALLDNTKYATIAEENNLADGQGDEDGSLAATLTFLNPQATEGIDLPETGAISAIVCIIAGLAVTTTGSILLIRSNRKEDDKANN